MSPYLVSRGLVVIAGAFLLSTLTATTPGVSTSADPPPPRRVSHRLIPDAPQPPGFEFTQLHALAGFSGPVYSLAWSPDGGVLASAAYGTIVMWDPDSGEDLDNLTGHDDFVWGLAWSPDGSTLASASADGTVKLWRASDHGLRATLSTGWAMCVAWSPDGERLAVGTDIGRVQIWEVASRTMVRELRTGTWVIISTVWSSDGDTLAVGDLAGRITLWNPETGDLIDRLDPVAHRSDTNGLAWSPGDSLLASAHQDGDVWIWHGVTYEPVTTLEAHAGWARGVAFSPDGRLLVSTGEDGVASVWWTASWELVDRLRCPPEAMWSVAWSPDGSRFALGSGRYDSGIAGTVFVWEVAEAP